MENIIFTPVETTSDLTTLHQVIQVVWPEVFTDILGQEQVDYMVKNYQSIEKIKSEIADGAKYYLVVLAGEIIGYTAYVVQEDTLYISKLYLLADVRGRGIAKKIMSWLVDIAKTYDKPKLSLRVNRLNTRAISVYQHFGFQNIREIDTPFGEFTLSDYVMEKQLFK